MMRVALAALLLISAAAAALAQRPGAPPPPPPFSEREITEADEAALRLFKAGNNAFAAGRYEEAIQLYDQCLKAVPDHPAIWSNKAGAHALRGTTALNAAAFTQDAVARKSGLEAARRDFREAAAAAGKAVELLNNVRVPAEPALRASHEAHLLMALQGRAEALRLMASYVDQSYATAAAEAFHDYIDAETDEGHRRAAQLSVGQMLLMANKYIESSDEYQKLVAQNPYDAEALVGAGVALVNYGFATNDQATIERGLDYLRRFVESAPASHRLKGSTEEALAYLKQHPPTPMLESPAVLGARGKVIPPDQAAGAARPPVDAGVINGKAVSLPKPPYPLIAKFARAQSTVSVQVLIDEGGNVKEARAIGGHPLLRAVSVAAALRAKFTPTLLSGQPVNVTGVVTYNFVAQ